MNIMFLGCQYPNYTKQRFECRQSVHKQRALNQLRTNSTSIENSSEPAYFWTGNDEFSEENDRLDLEPLKLPELSSFKRVVLVRHGESTWNASGRVQGSSDVSVLTSKGISQAETTQQMLENEKFDMMFVSPLQRSQQTANVVWGERDGSVECIKQLREIDLYAFQGLFKQQGKEKFGEAFEDWKRRSHLFEISGHAPVRELWYRASLAWQSILNHPQEPSTVLVVAHNAVNQALINTAIRNPPVYFRRLLQSNGAVTVLDFEPGNGAGSVLIDRMNASPGSPFQAGAGRKGTYARVVLVRHGATMSNEDGVLAGLSGEGASALGEVQNHKTGELLMDADVACVVHSPARRCEDTARQIRANQGLKPKTDGASVGGDVELVVEEDFGNANYGSWQGRLAGEVKGMEWPADAEPVDDVVRRVRRGWGRVLEMAGKDGGQTVVVVAHDIICRVILMDSLGLETSAINMFRVETGGVSVLEYPDDVANDCVARCTNFTAHLGRWAVPITQDRSEMMCGIEGCF